MAKKNAAGAGCANAVPVLLEFWMCASPDEVDATNPTGDPINERFVWRSIVDAQQWLSGHYPDEHFPGDCTRYLRQPELLRERGFVARRSSDGAFQILLIDDPHAMLLRGAESEWAVTRARMGEGRFGRPAPVFWLDESGVQLFEDFTQRAFDEERGLAILLDGEVVAATLTEPISSGRGFIPGRFTATEARCLSQHLK